MLMLTLRHTDANTTTKVSAPPPSHQALADYPKKSFAWRDANDMFRLLRRNPQEGVFEVDMVADVYDVVKHHVVFGSIVVPGVEFTEMALEATRKLFGHGAALTDMNMMFPFVVPYRVTGVEPASVMRFALKGDKKFEIQSVSPGGKVATYVLTNYYL